MAATAMLKFTFTDRPTFLCPGDGATGEHFTYPDVFHKFSNGVHVIRRDGLSSYFVAKQTNKVPQNGSV